MLLFYLAAVYLVMGLVCAVATARRDGGPARLGLGDAALALLVWPLYVPVLLGRPAAPERGAGDGRAAHHAIAREQELLLAALEGIADRTLADLLPSRAQITRLVEHLHTLDGKVAELDEVLARDDFDAGRAERALCAAKQRGAGVESAGLVCESIRRLEGMRDGAAAERDDLLGLCAQLRTQVTVLRFAGAADRDDVRELVDEICARVEGVGAAALPRLESVS